MVWEEENELLTFNMAPSRTQLVLTDLNLDSDLPKNVFTLPVYQLCNANAVLYVFLQFIIGEDGTCGANYEHAPAEGPPIVALIDHVVEYT